MDRIDVPCFNQIYTIMSIPKEPRQQMINIMYLVLIAMLAMNVSNEVIGAFKELNRGIEKNSNALEAQFAANKSSLENAVKKNQYGKVYESKLPEVEKINADFVNWVEELQNEIKLSVAPAEEWEEGWPKRLDDQAATTRIMIEEGKGKLLQEKIEQARKDYLAVFNPEMKGNEPIFELRDQTAFETELQLAINEIPNGQDWAEFNFNQMPLVAVITLLNKLKNDSKSTAASAVKRLKDKVTKEEIAWDQFKVAIVPNSQKLTQGDKLRAEIFLAAASSQSRPSITINGKNYPVDGEGVAVFETQANQLGQHNINATINYKDGYGRPQQKKQSLAYNVVTPASHAPLVSPTAMNVLYIGLDNPITASIIGIRDDKVNVSVDGNASISRASGAGNYTVKVKDTGEVNVKVNGTSERGEAYSFSMPFRTKRVPDPVPMLGNCSGCAMRSGEFRAQAGLRAELKDFVFENVRYDIKSYEVMFKKATDPDLKRSTNRGKKFTDQTKRLIDQASPGDAYYFEEIRAVGPDGKTRTLPNIAYRIL